MEIFEDNGEFYDVTSKKSARCGRKKNYYGDQTDNLKDIPIGQRGTPRRTYVATGLPTMNLHRNLKEVKVFPHNNTINPLLKTENKPIIIEFSTSFVDLWRDMLLGSMDVIHADEKWLYMKNNTRTFYFALGEEETYQATKSTRFIEKAMFLAAVARPHLDMTRNRKFNRNI